MDTLTLPARMDSLETFLAFALEKAERAGASETMLQDIRLGLEELLVNIISYAYPAVEGSVTLSFSVRPGRKAGRRAYGSGDTVRPSGPRCPGPDAGIFREEDRRHGGYILPGR